MAPRNASDDPVDLPEYLRPPNPGREKAEDIEINDILPEQGGEQTIGYNIPAYFGLFPPRIMTWRWLCLSLRAGTHQEGCQYMSTA